MKMNKEALGNFIKSVQYDLLPVEDQKGIGASKDLFVEDWLTIEVSKYIYIGKTRYFDDPIPKRLEGNQNFDQKRVAEIAKDNLSAIELLEKDPGRFDFLKIYNIKRGICLLLASFIKSDFKEIVCFDSNSKYENPLRAFFGDRFKFYSNLDDFLKLYRGRSTYVIKSVGLQEYADPSWFKGAL